MTSVRPPKNVEPFVEILGEELCIRFLLAFGGAPIYLTDNPQSGNRVAGLVGQRKTAELADRFGSRLSVYIPTPKHWIAAALHSRGVAVQEIARTLHCSIPTVRKYCRLFEAGGTDGDPANKRQLDLPL